MKDLLEDAARRSLRYLEGLDKRAVSPKPEALEALAGLDEPFPETPMDPGQVLRMLDEIGSPAAMGNQGGRYFGFVIGGVLPAALAANWLAGVWDQNAFSFISSPVGVALENISARWLLEALDLPADTGVSFVTGATMANFTALCAARHAVLAKAGWDVDAHGLFGAPEITVVVGAEAHPTVLKALGMLGLGRERVVTVPADEQGRMRADRMPQLKGPAMVCLQAGNVNTGAFDPVGEICDPAHKSGAWVHVDGAFGLWAKASPKLAVPASGLEKADSWATDGHKWLNVPYDCGLSFIRDKVSLWKATSISAAYLPDEMRFTPEASRRARGVEVYAALKSLGRSGLANMIEQTCRHAVRFADGLTGAGYDVLNEVVLNQVLVSFGSTEKTTRVIDRIQAEGTCWCGGTVWQGRTAMRISVSSWATTDEDVERSLAVMLRLAAEE